MESLQAHESLRRALAWLMLNGTAKMGDEPLRLGTCSRCRLPVLVLGGKRQPTQFEFLGFDGTKLMLRAHECVDVH